MADDNQKNADFIDRVVSDANNPPETRMLTGWFGNSGEDGYRRLYTDAELSNYIDIPDDAILYSEPVRDAQPSGCVMVWIKRDTALKQGGSAASRAARFLQGQVQQDFASAGAAGSLDKAGLRCITEVPCGEPTGFTGRCTKQPDVGGAWPCITAIPHCYEVTGFTGKCTQAPWPNPTRYIGCTILHCPTHDLTHIPHICNIVASGQPGCVVVDPGLGGDPVEKVGAAEADAKAIPATAIPGCGYTKSWGVCETHLLGCNQGARGNADAAYITSICQPTAFCHVSQNCGGGAAFAAAANVAPTPAAPCVSIGIACTVIGGCTVPPTSPEFKCTQSGPACPPQTVPQTQCTQSGPQCPTSCGPDCQSQQVNCTSIGPVCGHNPCTNNPDQCPSLGIICPVTDKPDQCPSLLINCPNTNVHIVCAQPANAQAFAAPAPKPAPLTQVGCPPSDFVACSLFGGCPTLPKGDCTFFGCPSLPQQFGAPAPGGGCTQGGPQCPPTPATICTQFAPCPTHAKPQCTFFGPACPPTPGIICTQLATCKTHSGPLCPSQQFECTMFCTQGAPGCPQTINSPACVGPITVSGQQCPVHTGFNCPSAIGCQSIACQSIACQSLACQPGGGIQHQAFGAAQPVTSTPNCGITPQPNCGFAFGAQPQAAAAIHPAIGTQVVQCGSQFVICTHLGPQCPPPPSFQICPLTLSGPQCPIHTGFNCPTAVACPSIGCPSLACQSIACQPQGGVQQMAFAQQAVGGPQTAATVCTQLNCPNTLATLCTQLGPQCPPHPTGGIDCTVVTCTHIGPQCPPHTAGCPSPGVDCTAILCTHIGPQCPITRGPTICTQLGPQCPQTPACPTPLCTHLGPQCPTLGIACTQTGPQCPPHQTLPICPITVGGPQCPPASGFNCPSALGCQSIACGQSVACVSAGCQPGGGGQRVFGAAFDQSTEFCPTSGGCGGVAHQAAIGGYTPLQPTPATHCFVCPPFDAAAAQRLAFPPRTFQLQCNPHSGLPFDCPFPSLFYVCTFVSCTVVQCLTIRQ